jgi:hypothetical protein
MAKPNKVSFGGNSNNAATANTAITYTIKLINSANIYYPTHLTRKSKRKAAATAVLGLSTPLISASTNATNKPK